MMKLRRILTAVLCLTTWCLAVPAKAELLLVLPESVKADLLDQATLKKLYLGRTSRIEGLAVRPLALPLTAKASRQFMDLVLDTDPIDFARQWQIRQYSGRGTPPKEADSVTDLIALLEECEQCVAYLDSKDLDPSRLPAGYQLLPVAPLVHSGR